MEFAIAAAAAGGTAAANPSAYDAAVSWINTLANKPAVLVGMVSAAVAIVSGAFAYVNNLLERARTRAQRAIELYNYFYSPETYRCVVAPVMRMRLKWHGLTGRRQEEFKWALLHGWIGFSDEPDVIMKRYCGDGVDENKDLVCEHFRTEREMSRFTEHEAMTSFLYFWVRVQRLVDLGLISRSICKELMATPYGYYWAFVAELREELLKRMSPNDLEPAWVPASRKLEKLFGYS